MYTRDQIIADIRAVEDRLNRLTPAILQKADQPLPTGTWTVRDAVCHMAADGNAVPRFLARVERARSGQPGRPAGFNLDAYNEEQIALRKPRALEDVLTEVREGLSNDITSVQALPEELLASDVPNFRGELTPASDQVRFTTAGHAGIHLDDIEAALKA